MAQLKKAEKAISSMAAANVDAVSLVLVKAGVNWLFGQAGLVFFRLLGRLAVRGGATLHPLLPGLPTCCSSHLCMPCCPPPAKQASVIKTVMCTPLPRRYEETAVAAGGAASGSTVGGEGFNAEGVTRAMQVGQGCCRLSSATDSGQLSVGCACCLPGQQARIACIVRTSTRSPEAQ